MADFTRVKILYTLNSSSQLLLARTRLRVPSHPSHPVPSQSAFLPLPLSSILTTILRHSPELCSDPSRDWSVYALDPREGRRAGGGMGVMEGRGLLSWVIAGEEEVVGRVGEGGEVEVGLRLQETKAITQQAHHAALAVLTRSPAPGTPNPSSSAAGSAHASPFFALRPPHSSPLAAYPSPMTSSIPTPELPSSAPAQRQSERPAARKRTRQPLAPLRAAPYHRTAEAERPVKHSASPAPASTSSDALRPQLQVQLQKIKSEPSPSPSPLPSPAEPAPVLGLGLALPRPSAPQPPVQEQPDEQEQESKLPPAPMGPIPPEALKSIADLLRRENGQGLLSALAGFLGVGKVELATEAQQEREQQVEQQHVLAQQQQQQQAQKKKKEDAKGDKENRRPAQPNLVMSKDGPCSNCGRVVTTVWRRPKSALGEEGEMTTQLLCNPCGIYQKNYAIPRPPWMWGDPEGLPKGRKRKQHPPSSSSGPSGPSGTGEGRARDSSLPPSSDPLAPGQPIIHIQGEGRKRRKRTVYDPEAARVEREGYFGRAVRAVQEEEERSRARELAGEVARALGGLGAPAAGSSPEAAGAGAGVGRFPGGEMAGSEMEVEGIVDGRAEVLRDLERVRRAMGGAQRDERMEKERIVIELDEDGEIVDNTPVGEGTPAALSSQGSASGESDSHSNVKSPEGSEETKDGREHEQEPEAPETPYFGALRDGGSLFTPADASSLCAAGGSSSSYSHSDAPTSPTPNPSQQRASCIPTLVLPQLQLHGKDGPSPVIPPSSPPGVGQRFDFSGLPPSSPVLLMEREDEDVEELDLTPATSGEGEEAEPEPEQEPEQMEEAEDDLARFLQGEMSSEDIEGLFMVQEQRASPGKHAHSHSHSAAHHFHPQQGQVDYSQMGFSFPLDFGMFGPAGSSADAALSPAPTEDLPSAGTGAGMGLLGLGGEYSSDTTLAGGSGSGMDVDAGSYDFSKEFGEYMKDLQGAGFALPAAGEGQVMQIGAEELEEIFRTLDGDMGVLV
ncbi:hypothetical protein CALVIDRAFT_600388 [Calocera viscosa TUFC12733]|uniref:GATA-type domain-containing protein n=1 Tax=Calocera viscosa (strain TUFC12733) TaxID=1330018 RepID=A0A167JUE2_CALVF|nr:hypothetical protein CALVIDRAFT_600388 [Calocera viscosa TUFC12733]